MKLSDLKWWHWTLATIALAAVVRAATGGPLPFIGSARTPSPARTATLGRPERAPDTGPSMVDVVKAPGVTVAAATPELQRLTVDASVANPGDPVGLVDNSAGLVREIARALQTGVREDSSTISQVRVLVATKGVDRTGKAQAHLPLYALDFKAGDLFRLQPDKAPPGEVLALAANVVFDGADAHDAMRKWCAAGDHLNQAAAFCGRVTAAKGV